MPLMEPLQFGTRRSGAVSYLSPEDEDSLLRSAARTGLSGLGKVGNLLDVPGSMIRDLLTWLPGGVAPVNPLDQLLSPLSGENRTSGRDLLEGYGMRANRETGMGGWLSDPMEGVRDIAGFGVDVLTDPLTWLGLSGLGRGGSAASKSGLLDDLTRVATTKANVPMGTIGPRQARMTTSLDDLIAHASDPVAAANKVQTAIDPKNVGNILSASERAKPVGGLASWQPPFMDPIAALGTGPKSQVVAKFLDKWSPNPFELGSAFSNSPVGLSAKSLMKASVMGKLTPEVQAHASETFKRQQEARQFARGEAAERASALEKAGMTDSDSAKLVRQYAEQIPSSIDVAGVGGSIRGGNDRWQRQLLSDGYDQHDLSDNYIQHVFRQTGESGIPSSKGPLIGKTSADVGRLDILKGYASGTSGWNGLETIVTDPDVRGAIQSLQKLSKALAKTGITIPEPAMHAAIGKVIEGKFGTFMDLTYPARNADGLYVFKGGRKVAAHEIHDGRWVGGNWERLDSSGNVVETLVPVLKHRPTELAGALMDNPKWGEKGLFPNHPIVDAQRYDELAGIKHEDAVGVYDFLKDYARPKDLDNPGKPVGQFLKDVGLPTKQALLNFGDRIGQHAPASPAHMPAFLKDLRDMEIDMRLADDYLAPRKEYKLPDAWNGPLKAWDGLTNMFKAGVLTWPARYVRDIVSGQARNLESGMFDTGSALSAHRLIHGGDVAGSSKIPAVQEWLSARGLPVTDRSGTDAIRQMYAKLGPGRTIEQTEAVGGVPNYATGIDEVLDLLPGHKPSTVTQNIGDVLNTAIGREKGTTLNPLDIRGVGDRTETKFGPVAAGEKIGRYTDDMNRLVPFINQLKKGIDPQEAMRRIEQAQVSYDPKTFTPTERGLKRLLPFYSFTSRQLKYAGDTLTTNPGGGMGQTIRAVNAGRSQNELVPEHISDTAAIPLTSKLADGTKRYLTGVGLMLEDPLSLFGGPRATGLELLSRLNPLVKGPLEWSTGQTFFQKGPAGGRALDDLDPTLGRILANVSGQEKAVRTPDWLEAIIGNSPATRAATTARQLTDTRKTWLDKLVALGTGVRVSDVSPGAQDAMEREWLQRAEKAVGGKMFTKSYIPKDVKAEMSPTELANAMKLEALSNVLAKRAKERKHAKEKVGR